MNRRSIDQCRGRWQERLGTAAGSDRAVAPRSVLEERWVRGTLLPHSTFRLLTVFAYRTHADHLAEAQNLPPLTEAQKGKFWHLSIVTLAAKVKCILYAVPLEALVLQNMWHMEDPVTEAVYADVIRLPQPAQPETGG